MAMTIRQLKAVRAEMDRLESRIVELIAAEEVAREEQVRNDAGDNRRGFPIFVSSPLKGSAESGAVRRASLDLTRALAELRKS